VGGWKGRKTKHKKGILEGVVKKCDKRNRSISGGNQKEGGGTD